MNLRLGENSVRFRLSAEDLDLLLKKKELSGRVFDFSWRIVPEESGEKMGIETSGSSFVLHVPRAVLENMRDMGKSKHGVSFERDGVEISLQMDLKTHRAA